ncbi:MAG: hypothetical protein A2Z21_02445 [Candidatus Fraserbacteria bacterium RBG_16_55_9]|uniref:Uncharacterized protein n=1 Tax=Fraserbacteria sp. (strain RBG_16_55_9) TaxID=1817864 RepID=A0A1F5V1R3_FRAXR|nr:MAG: hypothetical protein A2Z21_02445 [Candidatus Fraserbacteria bacterium RBG_16_55_9]
MGDSLTKTLEERFEAWRTRRESVRRVFYLLTILWIVLQILASFVDELAGFLQGYTTLFWMPWLASLFGYAWLEAQQEYFLKQVQLEKLSEQDRIVHQQMLSQARRFLSSRLPEDQLNMIQKWLRDGEEPDVGLM